MKEAVTETWNSIFTRLGLPEPRRGRAKCPLHNGDNPSSLSLDERGERYYCHSCGQGGDKIAFLMKVLETDFRGALDFLGMQPGRPQARTAATLRQAIERSKVETWCKEKGRALRDEHYQRERFIARARRRLEKDPEDVIAWNWLAWAFKGKDKIEDLLDRIDIGKPEQQQVAYNHYNGRNR